MDQHLSGVNIHHRQKEDVSSPAMDMHVLDVHGKELERSLSSRASEADKIPSKGFGSDSAATKQVVLLHQPVHLLMVDDPALILQFSCRSVFSIS
jgi:hypothetical protein